MLVVLNDNSLRFNCISSFNCDYIYIAYHKVVFVVSTIPPKNVISTNETFPFKAASQAASNIVNPNCYVAGFI